MLYLNSHQSKRRAQRGQSLVEVSLSMMFFFIFMLGLLDLGRVYFYYVALEDTAGEAAVFLSINPECNYSPDHSPDPDAASNPADALPAADSGCDNPNNGYFRAKRAAGNFFDWSETTVDIDYITGGQGIGNTVRVEIAYPFRLYTPIINNIVGDDTLTLRAIATQTIMME